MKLAITSDVHLEFGDLYLHNDQKADVLILSGDILVASDLKTWLYDESAMLVAATSSQKARADRFFNFIRHCLDEFNQVVFVMGNHEHYHGDYAETAKIIKDTYGQFNNFHFLDNNSVWINDVLFFGGTLWTDFNGEDPKTMRSIQHMMNDFNCVKNSRRMVSYKSSVEDPENPEQFINVTKERVATFTPEDALEEHKDFLNKLQKLIEENPVQKTVVVGHHAPSRLSTHPRYAHDRIMNGGYSSYLDNIILDNPQIKLWTHGHTHEDFDYMIGSTRIVCNPRGYDGYETRADNFSLKFVEI